MRFFRFALAACALLLAGGCIFAPTKFGPRGVVYSNSAQYRDYLANCRALSPVLDSYCRERGEPLLIQIGHSGGYFIWRDPDLMIGVGSFARTRVFNAIPPKTLIKTGLMTRAPRRVVVAPAAQAQPAAPAVQPIAVLGMDYDSVSRKGTIRVRFPEGRYGEARQKARNHIESLARDKGAMLRTGETTSSALYSIGAERVKDGVLEMEFTTE